MTEGTKTKLADFVANVLLKSKKGLNSLGIGTGAMIAGFVGTVTGFEFGPVEGARTVLRNNDQIIKIDGVDVVIAAKGEPAQAFYMVFDGGSKRVATTLLEQNLNSAIKIGSDWRKFSEFVGEDYGNLIGTTIKCSHAARDMEAAPIQRIVGSDAQGNAVMGAQQPMLFKFETVAAAAPAAPTA